METEKIGISAWFLIRRHSRALYLNLKDTDLSAYTLEPGDKLKVEIQAVKRGPRDQEGKPLE